MYPDRSWRVLAAVLAVLCLFGALLTARPGESTTVAVAQFATATPAFFPNVDKSVVSTAVVTATAVPPTTTAVVSAITSVPPTAMAVVPPTVGLLPTATLVPQTGISLPPTSLVSATNAVSLKSSVLLPMAWEAQGMDNCGPVAVKMAASVFGVTVSQQQAASILKPNPKATHTIPEDMVAYIRTLGLESIQRENGSLDTLRRLLNAGVPVIVIQWLQEGKNTAHYRVMRGYNLANDTFIYNDSMSKGSATTVSAATLERMWKSWDHRYFPVYSSSKADDVRAVLGDDSDQIANLSRAYAAAKAYAAANPSDVDAWRNLGYLDYALGDYGAALDVWENHLGPMLGSVSTGVYNHFLWYQLWPVESYNKVGKYTQAISLVTAQLATTTVYAEARYQYAIALLNSGQRSQAIAQLQQAQRDYIYYAPSRHLLRELGVDPA